VDERFQITFTTIDKIPIVVNDKSVSKGSSVIILESVPALFVTYSDLRIVDKKCKFDIYVANDDYRMFFPSHYFNKLG